MTEKLLRPKQTAKLEKLAETSASLAEQRRARVLLLYHSGQETHQIAGTLGLSERSVQRYRKDFLEQGMGMFSGSNVADKSMAEPGIENIANEAPPDKVNDQAGLSEKEKYPRVRKNPGIKADDSMAEAGRKILRFHFARMVQGENGTILGEDIEELHDMRVATRRMRSAFDVFAPFFKPKVIKKHIKGLRATGRALGKVRDLDVFMEKARTYLDSLPDAERSGLDPLLNAWAEKRVTERDAMLAHLKGKGYQQFRRDFNKFVYVPVVSVESSANKEDPPELVRQFVPVLIYTQLAVVRAYENIVANATIEQLHALRTEFKKLRYTVENFREVLGEESKDVIEDIKSMQDHLGDLNDAHVACQILRQFIETWEDRQINLPLHERKNPEPVVAYLAAKHAERHQLLITFPEAWAKFNRPEFRKKLALSISVL